MEYTLLYRCRKCDDIEEIIDTEESVNSESDLKRYIKSKPKLFVSMHECNTFTEETVIGITDLVGFSLLSDNEENI